MNWSSEVTQFNNPLSCLVNSLIIDDTQVNSFCSPRAGSVTVIGKRIFSHSCISPSIVDEIPKFPIPIQVFTRIKRHKNQAKKLLKHRTTKSKYQEQPAPPTLNPQPSKAISAASKRKITINIRETLKYKEKPSEKRKERDRERNQDTYKEKEREKVINKEKDKDKHHEKSIFVKLNKSSAKLIPTEVNKSAALTDRPSGKLSQIIHNSMHNEIKQKRRKDLEKQMESEYKARRREQLQKQNSKIRLENSMKFKMEKFTPLAAWGIDERKHSEEHRQRIIKEIETQRNARRAEKNSLNYKQKQGLGLSNFLEIETELGFKPRSSSVISEAPQAPLPRKKSDPRIQTYIKDKKKQTLKNKKDQFIETIKQETKRIVSLKLLDINCHKSKKKLQTTLKSRSDRKKFDKTLKKKISSIKPTIPDLEERNFEDKFSSDLIFEPDSAMRHGLSGFTEESSQSVDQSSESSVEIEEPRLEEAAVESKVADESSLIREKAIIKIQSHVRKFLVRKKYRTVQCSYSREDNEVRNIISSWQQSISEIQHQETDSYNNIVHEQLAWQEHQLEGLEELKRKEIREVIEISKLHAQDPRMIESITKIIDARYEYISNILQKSIEIERSSQQLIIEPASNIVEEAQEDSEESKENRCLEFSFPSYRSDKSLQDFSFPAERKEKEKENERESESEREEDKEKEKVKDKDKENERDKEKEKEKEIETEKDSISNLEPSEITVFQGYRIQDTSLDESGELGLSEIKNLPRNALISRASPCSDNSDTSLPLLTGNLTSPMVTASMILSISEHLLLQCLDEELYPYKMHQSPISINKDPASIQTLLESLLPADREKTLELQQVLSKPLVKNPLKMLADMQGGDKIGRANWDYSMCPAILSPSVLAEVINRRQGVDEGGEGTDLQESQVAHDKLIFDNCNEFLQNYRPYGIRGMPMPWSIAHRVLKPAEYDFDQIFSTLRSTLYKLSAFRAGKIPDQSFSVPGNSEEALQKDRDEKIGMLIAGDIANNEEIWVNYEYEEIQTVIDMTDIALEALLWEVIKIVQF